MAERCSCCLSTAKQAFKFDLIFLDAPYGSSVLAQALEKIAQNKILSRTGLAVVEHHVQDSTWLHFWQVYREKKYGKTKITFLVLADDEPKREE